jgi:hypothetical protein
MGDPDPKVQAQLGKTMEINYRSGVGEFPIWPTPVSNFHRLIHVHMTIIFMVSNTLLNIYTVQRTMAYTFGELLLAMSSRRVHSQRLIAISKTYF